MRFPLQMLLIVALLTGLFAATPEPAHAADSPSASCSKYVGVTNRVAGCVRETIGNVTKTFFDSQHGFYPMVSKAIAAFLTLGVAIYGVLLSAGMIEKVGRDTLMFITKIALVGFFTQSTPLMYNTVIQAMDSTAAIVVQVTPKNGTWDGSNSTNDFGKIQCLQTMQSASEQAGKPVIGPWLGMDCLLDTVIGIKVDANTLGSDMIGAKDKAYNKLTSGKGLQRGMIFFFFSGMKTSVIGLILGILGFIFIWGIISMIIKALMIYIGGYIGITFMMIISPLFIPLVLFRQTKEYFDKWVKLTISFAMQPILILLFVSLNIAAVDLALSSGDYSVMYRIAGDASRQPNFNLNSYFDKYQAIVQKPATFFYEKTDANSIPKVTDITKGNTIAPNVVKTAECLNATAIVGSGKTCPNSIPVQMWRDTVDWDKLAKARKPAVVLEDDAENVSQQISREILAACIFLGIVVFVMNKLMTVVPYILVDLVGDFGQTPSLSSAATGAGDTKGGGWNASAQQMAAGAEGSVQSGFNSLVNKLRETP
jgi:hypothetical protein